VASKLTIVTDPLGVQLRFPDRTVILTPEEWLILRELMADRMLDMLAEMVNLLHG
jgi:hypothetical protein